MALKHNPTVVTLDLGTKTGWALHADGRRLSHGTVVFDPLPHRGPGHRFLRFKTFLVNMKQQVGTIDYLLHEEVGPHVHQSHQAAVIYGGFVGVLTYWCEHHGIWYRGVHNQTLKAAAGSGRFTKPQMVEAVEKFFKIELHGRDDEADALALLIYFHKKLWPELKRAA